MNWRRKRSTPENRDTLERAQRAANDVTERGHRVARSLEDRLARNHFAALMAQTMTGETP